MHKKPFVLLITEGAHIKSRLGIIIGRKIGGAVLRNKIKRYLRHAFNELMQDYTNSSVDMVLIIKKHYHQFDKAMIKENLQDLVLKINIKSPC